MEYVVKIPMVKVERGHLHVNRNFEEIDFAQQSQFSGWVGGWLRACVGACGCVFMCGDRFHKDQ